MMTTEIKTTAGELAQALWNGTAHECIPDHTEISPTSGRVCYAGTRTPVRRVPENAPVTLVVEPGGGYVKADSWIADRFGRLGVRECKRALRRLTI